MMKIYVFISLNELAKSFVTNWSVNPIKHYNLMEDLRDLIVLPTMLGEQYYSYQLELSIIILM